MGVGLESADLNGPLLLELDGLAGTQDAVEPGLAATEESNETNQNCQMEEVHEGDTELVQARSRGTGSRPLYTKMLNAPLLTTPSKCNGGGGDRLGDASNKKEAALQASRKSTRLANRPATTMTIEEQGTALLMTKTAFLANAQPSGTWGATEIGNKFAEPLPDEEVTEYRDIFGLSMGEGTDALCAVAVIANA